MRKVYNKDSLEIKQLIKQDPLLEDLFISPKEVVIDFEPNYFIALVSTIVSQQLSGVVARVIYNRLFVFCDNNITIEKILKAAPDDLRALGLSYRKIEYLKSLATLIKDQTVVLKDIHLLDDEEAIQMLVKVKGIGRWSAQMFLLFSLGKDNVFSSLDLGLRKGVMKLYNKELTQDEIENISLKWHPYKSVVSFYLWRYLER